MLDRLPAADVVLLGEVHDNALHHDHQARAVAAIGPAALVLEMLTPDQAAAYRPGLGAEALAEAFGWAGSGWPDFALYYPILAAAPEARVLGGGVPRDQVRRAVSDGAAAVFGDGAARFGLDRALDPDIQAAREALQLAAHCNALPAHILPGMVEAQRLRDAALADAALQAWQVGGGPVVLITGTGHARTDWGVPALLAKAAPELSVFSLGQLERAEAAPPPDVPPFDAWIVTPPAQRPDPCEAFR